MKLKVFLILFLFSFSVFAEIPSQLEKPFVVMIPSYNNKKWAEKTLDSVLLQNYHNFRVIYIDDASPDGTGVWVKKHVKENGWEDRVTILQNRKRVGALANVYKGIGLCQPHEIVVNLDGDDWLAHENVLNTLNRIYSDSDVWVTYGQFEYYPSRSAGWADQMPEEIILSNSFREYSWVCTALRTFYAGLFHRIKLDDLLLNGKFFPMSGDLAYMWPVMEMAGTHSRFIPEVLYIYNYDTPINDIKLDPNFQQELGFIIRERERYSPVNSPY